MAPVLELVIVLADDADFLNALRRVRSGETAPDAIAARYVRREGRTRHVLLRLIRSAAAQPIDEAQAVLELGAFGSGVGEPDASQRAPHWPHAKRGEAALMLSRLGAGRCIRCAAILAGADRRRYCSAHQPRGRHAESVERSDREAITALLNAVGDALAV